MHSLFSDVSVSLNENLVSPPTSLYQLSQKHVVLDVIHVATGNRIYFDFYTSDGVFTAGLFKSVMRYKDTPGNQDKRTTDNKGFTSRKAFTAQSKFVQMMEKLHLDLFCQEK
jgi:hypothetical protein